MSLEESPLLHPDYQSFLTLGKACVLLSEYDNIHVVYHILTDSSGAGLELFGNMDDKVEYATIMIEFILRGQYYNKYIRSSSVPWVLKTNVLTELIEFLQECQPNVISDMFKLGKGYREHSDTLISTVWEHCSSYCLDLIINCLNKLNTNTTDAISELLKLSIECVNIFDLTLHSGSAEDLSCALHRSDPSRSVVSSQNYPISHLNEVYDITNKMVTVANRGVLPSKHIFFYMHNTVEFVNKTYPEQSLKFYMKYRNWMQSPRYLENIHDSFLHMKQQLTTVLIQDLVTFVLEYL